MYCTTTGYKAGKVMMDEKHSKRTTRSYCNQKGPIIVHTLTTESAYFCHRNVKALLYPASCILAGHILITTLFDI